MKSPMNKRSILAIAVAACSTSAYVQAQDSCEQQIRALEQRVEQRQLDQNTQREIQDMLKAAKELPDSCQMYVANAEQRLSQASGQQTAQQTGQDSSQQTSSQSGGNQGIAKASDIQGQSVTDSQGQEVGSIDDLAITMEDGELAYVVISTGGMMNKKRVGVPADMLQPASGGEGYTLSASKQEVDQARSLPDENWPAQPTLGGQTAAGGTAQPASQVMGKSVKDSQGNSLGQIEDFAVDLQQGKLAYVVVGAGGGMLGLGDQKLVGLPIAALQQAQDGYVASVSKRDIEQAPDLPEQNWPQEPTIASAGEPEGAGGVQQSTRIQGQTVTSKQGETLGRIEGFALDMKQGKLAYVAIGTSQGKTVGIPADMLEASQAGDGYVADLTPQQLQDAEALPQQNWPDQPSIASASGSAGGQSSGQGEGASFSSIDQDQNGYISKQEAEQASDRVAQNFEELDQNSDEQIDRTEFAAFEPQQQ